MSPRVPRITASDAITALKRAGFEVIRERGSHKFLAYPGDHSRWATVADHGKQVLSQMVLHSILKTSGLTMEEFMALL
ncbi:MAG: type II toxin-antitoxin system HicA family toxin [Syntrophomonas sp.]